MNARAPEGSVFSVRLEGEHFYVRGRTAEAVLERAAEEAGVEDLEAVGYSLLGPLYGDERPDESETVLEVDA